ncbi:GntR family transcriptional regulator [Streptomyces sp. CB02009]|uniref:GntR family transcriptional regulator n=1 Tax=Streptomyces sp. CB02009 TaxID=1703938 RepID=UPI00093DB65C|nr:GntR family transcriptional regulator [Streptomyces sp. CB02009]OKJ62164.1 GntR family transcriptional regulator [Streptomyces sp. CB02009]
MEQGAARERATERPSPPFGDAARGPEEAARVPEQARSESARGEHTHGEPAAPGAAPAPGAAAAPASGVASAAASGPAPVPARAAVPAARTAPAARVVRHSVRGQILDALRTALVGGELVPGEVYSAPALGERFGVSATPVREAMQRLAVEGAVEVVPNRGFRVTERTPRELAELAEVRALIEVPVMLRLARTVPAGRWAELRPLAEATSTAAARGDRAHYAEADRAFHRAVLSLAGNEQLLAVADDLHRRSQWPLISAPVVRHGVLVADAAEHTALLDALTAQDLTVVEALVREHFTGSNA